MYYGLISSLLYLYKIFSKGVKINDRKVLIIAKNKILELLKKWFFEENNLITQTAVFSNLFPLKKFEEAEIIFIFVPFTQNMNYLEFFMYTNPKLHTAYKDKKRNRIRFL